ncbi:MAG: hypothetical protein ACT4PS_17835 [Betaproteobacteria bacterium]
MEKDVQFAFRVEGPLRDEFVRTCKSMDRSAGQVLREFMRDFISEHVQVPLFQEPVARYKATPARKSRENS